MGVAFDVLDAVAVVVGCVALDVFDAAVVGVVCLFAFDVFDARVVVVVCFLLLMWLMPLLLLLFVF